MITLILKPKRLKVYGQKNCFFHYPGKKNQKMWKVLSLKMLLSVESIVCGWHQVTEFLITEVFDQYLEMKCCHLLKTDQSILCMHLYRWNGNVCDLCLEVRLHFFLYDFRMRFGYYVSFSCVSFNAKSTSLTQFDIYLKVVATTCVGLS